jgi:hypothetical protein
VRSVARPESNRRVLILLFLIAAMLFFGSILFIVSRAQP